MCLCIQIQIQNKTHSKGELRLYFISFETCKIMYCHQTPKRGRLKEHFPPNWFWRLLTIHYLLMCDYALQDFIIFLHKIIGFYILQLIFNIAQRKLSRKWWKSALGEDSYKCWPGRPALAGPRPAIAGLLVFERGPASLDSAGYLSGYSRLGRIFQAGFSRSETGFSRCGRL